MKTSNRLRLLFAVVLACSPAAAQLVGNYSGTANLAIPSSGTGGVGCGSGSPNVTEFTVAVPDAFVLSSMSVKLTLTHTYVGDLTLTLSHCGTSVVLYDRTPSSASDLNGEYIFGDGAPLAFANAVSQSSGLVPPGAYLPINPVTPFHGMSTAGDWTIKICDSGSGDVGVLSAMEVQVWGVQFAGGTISPVLSIPDGNNGCQSPVTHPITVANAGLVDAMTVELGLTHTWVRDLNITIAHDGVAVTLSEAGTIKAGILVMGNYTFSNIGGPLVTTFDDAAAALPSGFTIQPGLYVPDQSLEAFRGHQQAGVWLVTICDTDGSDVGTLSYASIMFSSSPYALAIHQPFGAASIWIANSGGSPGHVFLNLVTLTPGTFPYGWLNGLDIPMAEIANQVNIGAPFIGVLDNCGSHVFPILSPVPSGVSIQLVSFELDQNLTPVASVPAFNYITI